MGTAAALLSCSPPGSRSAALPIRPSSLWHLPDLRDELLRHLQSERGVLGTEANGPLEMPDEISPELRERLESLGYLEQP